MSVIYLDRLRSIRDEYDTAFAALAFIAENWHRREISGDAPYTYKEITVARDNLATAYFLLVAAEFESILRAHLSVNHASVKFPARKADWKVDWFLSRVCQRERISIEPALRTRLDNNRDYRNSLAHGDANEDQIPFNEALSAYNAFVSRLPEPLGKAKSDFVIIFTNPLTAGKSGGIVILSVIWKAGAKSISRVFSADCGPASGGSGSCKKESEALRMLVFCVLGVIIQIWSA